MATIIPVRFAYAARDLWFNPGLTGAQEGDHLICSTERGTEIGLATAGPSEVSDYALGKKTGNAALKPVLRVASDGDLEKAEELAQLGDDAMPVFRRLVSESGLDMKPVGVEYLFGRERVVCYFAAEERVDFRQLVRSLSHELHERIDMRQIGVREEAAVVGGFGHCGQELCCARFGLSFEPVSIRMAKEQDLPLTSNKISGACGRLMCCLRYEFEAYRDFKGRAPKRNAVIDTPLGKAKIVEYDTPKEQVALRLENGKTVRIPLAEMVASEAAVKKSEELHCPCRPDTVVRASLDKLSSPDVQMALAELDRKMGVITDDDFDSPDLFVESKPRKRRRRGSAQAQAQAQSQGQGQDTGAGSSESKQQETSSKSSRRRRRRSTKASVEGAQQGAQQGATQIQSRPQRGQAASSMEAEAAQDAGEKRTRRRRHRRSSTDAANQQGAQASSVQSNNGFAEKSSEKSPEVKTRRRRRHRSSSSDGNVGENGQQAQRQGQGQSQGQQNKQQAQRQGQRQSQQGQSQSQQNQRQGQGQGQQARPRRRPGDRGGQGTAQQLDQQPSVAPKRRRRRRGGRGRGGNGGSDASGGSDANGA